MSALHRLAAEHLDDGGAAPDHRHRPLVDVLERLRLLAACEQADGLARVLARLERDRPELRKHLAGLLVGDRGEIPDRVHLRVRGDAQMLVHGEALAALELQPEPVEQRVALQAGAPDERVGGQHGPGLQRDARRLDRLHDLARPHLDLQLAERLARVLAQVLLEHREEVRPRLDQRDRRGPSRHVGVVLRKHVVVELRERARRLDAGRPAADDHRVQRAVGDEAWVAVGRLPPLEDVVLQALRIRERVERECVVGGALDAEEIDLGPDGQDERVVGERLQLAEAHFARLQVDRLDGVVVHARVLLLLHEVAQLVADGRLLQEAGRKLVEQRLERVVVVLVDDHDLDVGLRERLRRADAGEPAAENENARPPFRHGREARRGEGSCRHPNGMMPVDPR